MAETIPVDMTNYIDQYMKEWEKENGCGWIAREFAARSGLDINAALLYLNWLEQLRYNATVSKNADRMAELLPLQIKMLKEHEHDHDEDKPWESE